MAIEDEIKTEEQKLEELKRKKTELEQKVNEGRQANEELNGGYSSYI